VRKRATVTCVSTYVVFLSDGVRHEVAAHDLSFSVEGRIRFLDRDNAAIAWFFERCVTGIVKRP
jgi:hypothetical protein